MFRAPFPEQGGHHQGKERGKSGERPDPELENAARENQREDVGDEEDGDDNDDEAENEALFGGAYLEGPSLTRGVGSPNRPPGAGAAAFEA